MWKEFKAFIMRGNVLDMAIGIIIGAAFGRIVSSLVNDVIMPPIGLLLGRVDFANLFIVLSNPSGQALPSVQAAKDVGAVTINYGLLINAVVDFLIVALVLFLVIQAFNRLRRQPAPPAPDTKECPYCCSMIPIKATRCPNCTSQLG